MQYLFLAYGDKRQWEAMSEAEREALTSDCAANDEALRLFGYSSKCSGSKGTAPSWRTSTTAGYRSQRALAQGQEPLRGAFAISARNLNQTIQLASTMPQARSGPIKVWPLSAIER